MISSDGSGMHADSIPISSATPGYPSVEITVTTKWCSAARMASIMVLRGRFGLEDCYSHAPCAVSYADTASETSASQLLQTACPPSFSTDSLSRITVPVEAYSPASAFHPKDSCSVAPETLHPVSTMV